MLRRWNPFQEMESLQNEMNRLFEEFAGRPVGFADTRYPLMDISETEDEIKVRALLPGLSKEEVNITIHQNVLTISGEKKGAELPEGARSARLERTSGSFQRTVRLNTRIAENEIQAQLRDGVLTLTLPKKEEAKPKQIAVTA